MRRTLGQFFRPNRGQVIFLFFLCLGSYLLISSLYVKKQKELTLELAEVSNNYAFDLLAKMGDIRIDRDHLYAGTTLLNGDITLVDLVVSKTGFGCTIFKENVRVSTTATAKNSNQRSIGSKANAMITETVFQNGETFVGVTETIGKSWIITYAPLVDNKQQIVGMLATFKEEEAFQKNMTFFKLYLALILGILFIVVTSLIEFAIKSNARLLTSKYALASKNSALTKAHAQITESEKRFKDLFENSYDLIQATDIKGKIQYVNPAWVQTLGYSEEEAHELSIHDIIHEDYIHHYNDVIHQALRREKVEGTDIAFKNKQGEIILVNGNIHCEFQGHAPTAIKGIFRNDTDRKLSQQKLEESEKQYRFLVESANDIIYETDFKGNFIYVNDVVEKITGYTSEELIGKNYLSIVEDSQKKELSEHYSNHLRNKADNSTLSFQMVGKTGRKIWIGQNVKTIYSSETKERILGYLAVARDITNEKNHQLSIERQKKLLEEKNDSITQSIRYAKRIQTSILPYKRGIYELFEHSFILFEPKDIVSGDFYWYKQVGDYKFVAVVDCTGHGVPAAFMSIIGNNQLNLAIKNGLTDPAKILEFVSEGVIQMQSSSSSSKYTRDGMDMSLCVINEKKGEIVFSGAKNPIYLIRNEELIKYAGSRISIGTDLTDGTGFENHTIEIQDKDIIYLFSDGFPDQFGGPQDKKYSYARFRETLLAIHHHPPVIQKEKLLDKLNMWKGEQEQIDDICIMGIKLLSR